MEKEEFIERLFEVCRDVNAIVMKHVALNRAAGMNIEEGGWPEQKAKMEVVAGEFYDELKVAFGKVGKFG